MNNSNYGSQFSSTYGHGDGQRQQFSQSPSAHGGGFTVAGMSSLGASSAPLSSSQWGASTSGPSYGNGLSDSLNQSRSHYTAGYIMVFALAFLFLCWCSKVLAATSNNGQSSLSVPNPLLTSPQRPCSKARARTMRYLLCSRVQR
jgi:hypothetical protein